MYEWTYGWNASLYVYESEYVCLFVCLLKCLIFDLVSACDINWCDAIQRYPTLLTQMPLLDYPLSGYG